MTLLFRNLRPAAVISIALAAALSFAPPAFAGDKGDKAQKQEKLSKEQRKAEEARAIRAAVQRGEVMPLPRILALAQAQVPGEVIEVELEQKSAGWQYEIKILAANGRVREVKLNARSGALIKIEDD